MQEEIDALRGKMDLVLEVILACDRRNEKLRQAATTNALASSTGPQKGTSDLEIPRTKGSQPTSTHVVNDVPTVKGGPSSSIQAHPTSKHPQIITTA